MSGPVQVEDARADADSGHAAPDPTIEITSSREARIDGRCAERREPSLGAVLASSSVDQQPPFSVNTVASP